MNKEEIQALLEEVEELPPKAQKAYFWCAANLRLLTALFQNKKFSEEKLDEIITKILEREDYTAFFLLMLKNQLNKYEEESIKEKKKDSSPNGSE